MLSGIGGFFKWAWHCAKAWLELGHRVTSMEAAIDELKASDDTVAQKVEFIGNDARDGRYKLHRRIDQLGTETSGRIDGVAAAINTRIDEWAKEHARIHQSAMQEMTRAVLQAVSRSPEGQ